jgi:hypothetical protein
VSGFFTRFLKRQADETGLENFTQALLHGTSVETVLAGIMASDEYFGQA